MTRRQMPWVRWNPLDFMLDPYVQSMSWQARAVYRELLDRSWVQDGLDSMDPEWVALATRIPLEVVSAALGEILPCWQKHSDGRFRQKRQERERKTASERSELGRKAARARWDGAENRPSDAENADSCGPMRNDAECTKVMRTDADPMQIEIETKREKEMSLVSEKSPRSGTVSSPRDPKGSDARGARSPAGAGETSKPKRRRKKSKTATKPKRTPPHLEFAEWFAERFEATRGAPYAITGPCRTAASRALKLAGGRLQDAQERAERLLGTSDAWLAQRATLSTLASRWNELAVEVQPLTPRQALRERNRRGLADWARQNTP